MIKSPLRYPGGKSRAINYLINYLPKDFREYREPLVGGGSMFIYLKQTISYLKIWINDLNQELYLFWKNAQSDLVNLVAEIKNIKENSKDGKKLFQYLLNIKVDQLNDLERAARFFVLNRITFSGTVESGGFSQAAFEKRFTDSSIERLECMEEILKDVIITNLDYQNVVEKDGKNTFIFLDPPYSNNTKSKLYGKRGHLHLEFNHQIFSQILQKTHHKWLVTYDNSLLIKNLFSQAHIREWELQYGMNNYKQSSATKGKELLITNYLLQNESKQSTQLMLNLY